MPETPATKIWKHPAKRTKSPESQQASSSSSLRLSVSPSLPKYAELAVTTNFTFLTGASHPEEFVERAANLGYAAAAIADTNTLAGIVRAHVVAKEAAIPLAVGCRLQMQGGLSFLVYPTCRAAYALLCRLLTLGKRRAPKGECHLTLDDVIAHQQDMLAVAMPPEALDTGFGETLGRLAVVFDDDRLSLAMCRGYGADDEARLAAIAELGARCGVPLVAMNDAQYHSRERRGLQDTLTCIRQGCTIDEAGFRLNANAERELKPPDEMARLFASWPEAIARSAEVALRAASFSLDELRYEYPVESCPKGKTPIEYLKERSWAGARNRYPEGIPPKVSDQLLHELELIEELGYEAYFLTCYDIVTYARKQGILCQGRGGAANSTVCYCLGITEVDPAKFSLLFERFVSRSRNEPPDIDIDFEHEKREEVMQYLYQKYGRDRAALTAEVITYRGRSAVRDVGKAMGLSLDRVDAMAKNLDGWSEPPDAERVREIGLDPDSPTIRRVIELTHELVGFPRHLSQHVGGFVITRTPLCDLVPIENAAMEDRTVIEWDKDDIDAMGMLKVDVLGLGMLTCLSKAFALVNRDKGTEGQRDKGKKNQAARRSSRPLQKEGLIHGNDQDVSRSHCLAAGKGTGEERLSSYSGYPEVRDLRPDLSDAPGRLFASVQHCRGICQDDQTGVSPWITDRERFTGGAGDTVGDCDRTPSHSRESNGDCHDGGTGSPAQQPNPKTRRQMMSRSAGTEAPVEPPSSLPFVPLSLCPFVPLGLNTIPWDDPDVYKMIQSADTIGVFQIESRAQMSMLPRLKPACFYDLVIEVAIVRPGPIQGNMVHPYLRRRNKEEPVTYPNPEIEKVLGRTLGVPLFQEQAMQLAIVAAGFTPDEADRLRRAMAAWKRKGNLILSFGRQLIDGMTARGYPREFAERCFEQIKGFSEYGFPESHAASFALLVYASSWLKRWYPAAFAAALINSQPMGFYAPAQIVRDAREHGVEVLAIDVNRSKWDCTLERSDESAPSLRLGLRLAKGLAEEDANRIADAVKERGPFKTIEALWRASGVPVAALRKLARADAFGSMGLDSQAALWQVRALRDEPLPLFDQGTTEAETREGLDALPEVAPSMRVLHDYSSTGLSLKAHPISFIRPHLDSRAATPNTELRSERLSPTGRRVSVAGVVLVRQRPGTASGVVFITLEDETGIANLIVWPKVFERFRRVGRLSAMLLARGRVERQGEVVHVHVDHMESLDGLAPELASASRDFH